VYKRYRAICPEVVPKKMTGDEPVKIRVPQERIEQLPELKVLKDIFLCFDQLKKIKRYLLPIIVIILLIRILVLIYYRMEKYVIFTLSILKI